MTQKCKTHNIAMVETFAMGGGLLCPQCFSDRAQCFSDREYESATGIIPYSMISADELSLFDNPLLDAEKKEIRIDLGIPSNAASFLALCESRRTRYVDFDSIQKIDAFSRTITLKG
jgi:hypothetical protein